MWGRILRQYVDSPAIFKSPHVRMVVLNEVQNMFWGVTIDGGKRYSQTVEKSFHVSMAALEPGGAGGTVSLMINHDKSEFLLCSLNQKHIPQQPLDLNFAEGEQITFFLNGQGVVHLSGYLMEDPHFDESDMVSDMSDSEDEDSDEAPQLVESGIKALESGTKRKKGKDKVTVAKKLRLAPSDSDSDEEDSDDDDEEDDDDDDEEYSDLGDSFIDDEAEEESDSEDEESSEESEDDEPTPKSVQKSKKQQQKQESAKKMDTSKLDKKTPADKGKESSKKKKETPAQQEKKTPKFKDTPQSPDTPQNGPAGDASAKKKKKKKKKKNKEDGATPDSTSKQTQGTPKDTPKQATPQKQVLKGGVICEETRVGKGPQAQEGKMMHVYYVGKLQKDGKQFDSCTSGKPFKFRLGKGEVIPGWDTGVKGMKVGGKRTLVVPASQAYGNQKQGGIPANSTLVFDVELKAVS